jgi:hypothetical protein
MDLVFIFNQFKGGNGYDLLFILTISLMFVFFAFGEKKIRSQNQ